MKVLVATAVYPPEPVVSARLSGDLVAHLTAQGHDVSVVCPVPSRGVDGTGPSAEHHAENGVTHVDSYRCRESRLIGRAWESLDFGRHVTRWIRASARPFDVIYANVWPLFGQLKIVNTAQALGIPVVLHVQDVYPESLATKLPAWLYRLGAASLVPLDRAIARRCAALVLISERIGRRYALTRGVQDRIHVVRNWVDESPFRVPYARSAACAEYDVPADRFTFMYLGNLSALSALDSAIRAFAKVAGPERQLVIFGEGSAKDDAARLADQMGLRNVLFRSETDAAKVALVQAMADVFLMPTKRGGALSSTPSKCISYMFSGRPILAAVDTESDAADDIRAADCGWVCEPENDSAIAETMELCIHLPEEQRSMLGSRARRYAERVFGRATGVRSLAEIILTAAGAHERPRENPLVTDWLQETA